MADKKLLVSLKPGTAMTVHRLSVNAEKLVYVIVAEKPLTYKWGRSRIVYVGTTEKGIERIAQSAAQKAPSVLNLHGVSSFEVRVLTCKPRQHVKTWHKLERAMLLIFRQTFGEVPFGNSHGSSITETDEFRYFQRTRIERVIDDLSS
jgi:hypothetical protein